MKQEILLHFVAEARFQSIEVFCGDVEFNAVSAELDFVAALMETVRNEPVFADEIVFEFIGHGIQLLVGKFEGVARLFLFGFPIGQDGTDGGEGSVRSRFGNGVRKQLLCVPAGYGIEKVELFHHSPEPKTENNNRTDCALDNGVLSILFIRDIQSLELYAQDGKYPMSGYVDYRGTLNRITVFRGKLKNTYISCRQLSAIYLD